MKVILKNLPDGGSFVKEGCLSKMNIFKLCKGGTQRWFIVTNDFICYLLDHQSNEAHRFFLYDYSCEFKYGRQDTGYDFGLLLQNSTERIILVANTQLEFCIWVQKIKDALSCSEWKVVDPLQIRFFSERMGNNCTSFVDGEQYFGELFNCLNLAEKEVYITGLLLCPFLYLKRPVSLNS